MVKPNIFPIYLLLHSRNPGACHVTDTRPDAKSVTVNEGQSLMCRHAREEDTPPFQGASPTVTFAVFARLTRSSGKFLRGQRGGSDF